MDTGIHIGASVAAVKEARLAIMDILESANGDVSKVAALETLKELCAVHGTTISGCTIDGGATHHHYPEQPSGDEDD